MAIELVSWAAVLSSVSVNSLWVTFLVTIAGATFGGLLIIWIQNIVPRVFRWAKRLRYGLWKAWSWPIYQKVGLILEERDMCQPNQTWGDWGRVSEAAQYEFLGAIRGIVRDPPSTLPYNGNERAWRLDKHTDSGSVMCWFLGKSPRFMRKPKGSERVIVAGRRSGATPWPQVYQVHHCRVVRAWRPLGEGRWLRVARWRRGTSDSD